MGSADISQPMEAVEKSGAVWRNWASRRFASCRGCGLCRPPTGVFTRFMWRVASGCAVLYPNWSYRTANAVGSGQAYLSRSGGTGVPGTDIVGGHIGYLWTDEAIAVATKHRNVYIDTSAYRWTAIRLNWWTN